MPIYKNPIAIVQGNQPSLLGQTVTATGSSATTLIKTPGGSYLNPSSSLAHGYLMADMTNTLLVNLHDCTSWRIILKFKFNSLTTDLYNGLFGSGNYSPFIYKNSSHKIVVDLYNNSRTNVSGGSVDYIISSNTWYYVAVRWENGLNIVSLYNESGTLLGIGYSSACRDFYNTDYSQIYLGGSSNSSWVGRNLEMDISECYYEKDGIAVWGETNSKTQNMGVFTFDDWSKFTEVEYIESTGTQYLDLGIVPNDTCGLKMDVMYTASGDRALIGCRNNASTDTRFVIGTNTGRFYLGWNSNEPTQDRFIADINTRYTVYLNYLNDRKRRCNDTYGLQITETLSTQTYNIYVFANNRAGTPATYSEAKLYGLSISFGSDIFANLKPCYHTATGIIGMFDIVNNKFYTNSGTGDFIKGPDVNNI